MSDTSSMHPYAVRKTQELVDSAVFALHDALRRHDAASVHRMRVSIRRLQQVLRVFDQYLSKTGVKHVKKQLKKCLQAAGELRNYDVALEILEKHGSRLPQLKTARTESKKTFRSTLQQITHKDLAVKWRDDLGLPS
jgi:CHAD domain-containing protein